MKRVLLVVLTIFLLGCVSSRLRQVSAGHIGCSHNNITISDHKSDRWFPSGTSTWVATCKGKRFICSKYSTGVNSKEVICVQEIE